MSEAGRDRMRPRNAATMTAIARARERLAIMEAQADGGSVTCVNLALVRGLTDAVETLIAALDVNEHGDEARAVMALDDHPVLAAENVRLQARVAELEVMLRRYRKERS